MSRLVSRLILVASICAVACLTFSKPQNSKPAAAVKVKAKSDGPVIKPKQPAAKPKPKPAPQKTILFFTANWCGACQRFKNGPLKALRAAGWTEKHLREVTILHSDAKLFDRYRIVALPTFVLTVDGKEIDRRVGYIDQWEIGRLYKSKGTDTAVADWRSALCKIGGCTGVCVHPSGVFLTAKHCHIPKRIDVSIDGQTIRAVRISESKGEGPVILTAVKRGLKLPYLKLAKELPKVGDTVYSLGYPADPGNVQWTFAFCEAKYLGKIKDHGQDFLFTNHRTLKGNSGGPLLNEHGEVIGLLSYSTYKDGDVNRSWWIPLDRIRDQIAKTKLKVEKHAAAVAHRKRFVIPVTILLSLIWGVISPFVPYLIESLAAILG